MIWKRCVFIVLICIALAVSCTKVDDKPICTLVPAVSTFAATSATDSGQAEEKERKDATALIVQDNYAYLGMGKTLIIVDVTEPANPTQVGEILLPYNSEGSFLVSGYLFADNNKWPPGTSIVAVNDPHNPALMKCDEETPIPLDRASFIEDYVFVAGGGLLKIYEATTETERFLLTEIASYQSSIPAKLRLTPKPHIVAAQPRIVSDVIIVGEHAYVSENLWGGHSLSQGRITIFDVSDPKAIKPVAVYNMPDNGSATRLRADDSHLMIENGSREGGYSILILDITSPEKPKEVSVITDFEILLTIHDDFIYTIASSEGWSTIRVRNVADPTNIVRLDWEVDDYWWLYDWSGEMVIVDHYAYFLYNRWLTIVDVTDPFDPYKVTTIGFR